MKIIKGSIKIDHSKNKVYNNVKEVIDDVKQFYNQLANGTVAVNKNFLGISINDEIIIGFVPYDWNAFDQVLNYFSSNAPAFILYAAALGALAQNSNVDSTISALMNVGLPLPISANVEETVAMFINNVIGSLKKLSDEEIKESLKDVIRDENSLEEAATVIKQLDHLLEKVVHKYNEVVRKLNCKDAKCKDVALYEAITSVGIKVNESYEEFAKIKREMIKMTVESSVLIKRLIEVAKRLNNKLEILKMVPVIARIMSTNNDRERIRLFVEKVVGVKYGETVGLQKENDVFYPSFVMKFYDDEKFDALLIIGRNSNKWIGTLSKIIS